MGKKDTLDTIQQDPEFRNLNSSEDEEEIDLSEIFYLLWNHVIEIILCLFAGSVAALLITVFLITPKYTATAKMYVLSTNKNSVVDLSSLQMGSQLTADYEQLITSRPLLEDVIKNLNLQDTTVKDVEKMITIGNPTDTRILSISVTTDDAQLSADMANQIAELAKEYLPDVMNTEDPSVYETAVVPQTKSSPSTTKNVLIGGVGLAFVYVAYLIVKYLMNDTFSTPEDINKYFGVQPLAAIPEGRKTRRKKNTGKRGKR